MISISASLIAKRLQDESMTLKCRLIQNGLITSTNGSTLNETNFLASHGQRYEERNDKLPLK
jgi:hypothetical protein